MLATMGFLASLFAILVYIWIRFEWQFAVGAIVATLHDHHPTLGLFVLTGMEFNLTSVAALLTIVGYSLNDTVVVYDRMRENLKRYRKMPLPILIDAAINPDAVAHHSDGGHDAAGAPGALHCSAAPSSARSPSPCCSALRLEHFPPSI